MKRVPKSAEEPSGLADFRSANPEGTWKQFQDEAQSAYDEVVAILNVDQGGLCAYCEINVKKPGDQCVEHFHPKADSSSVSNWHLDWDNLWLCCRGGRAYPSPQAIAQGRVREPFTENYSCDAEKGGEVLDERILNPSEIPAFPRIFKYRINDGEMQVDKDACEAAEIDSCRAQATIDLLGLNCARLKDARAVVIRAIDKVKKTARTHRNSGDIRAQTYQYLTKRFLTKSEAGLWPKFFTVARWSLGAQAERHLEDCGFDG
tara:strand:- start:11134 stop:11916 length:783 start_codon:yes stop_codon:yes gene_type:complete